MMARTREHGTYQTGSAVTAKTKRKHLIVVSDAEPKAMTVWVVGDNEDGLVSIHLSKPTAEKAKADHQMGLEMSGSNRIAYITRMKVKP